MTTLLQDTRLAELETLLEGKGNGRYGLLT
jgi:hypothetical protein